jgi:hypothetical protein
MRDLALSRNFEAELIPGPKANYATVISKLLSAAEALHRGDIFLLTFAGHGTGEFDENDQDEPDTQDEAIVLLDALLFDDELRLKVWPAFRKGVRVLMVADSCHSGTVAALSEGSGKGPPVREISQETRQEHLREYRQFYRQLVVPVYAPTEASVLLLAACRDLEKTPDDFPHGPFTAALLKVVNEQNPQNYTDLIKKVRKLVGPQIPQLFPFPTPDPDFMAQKPFTI